MFKDKIVLSQLLDDIEHHHQCNTWLLQTNFLDSNASFDSGYNFWANQFRAKSSGQDTGYFTNQSNRV